MEKYFDFDRYKTLQELDLENWGEPDFNSHLVTTCHDLRRKLIKDFSIEDLRIMIGQGFSLNYLIPIALEILEDNILLQGDMYPGDLLKAVLSVEADFWISNSTYKNDLESIIERNINDLQVKLYEFRKRNV